MTILVMGPFRAYSENPYLNDLPREAWATSEHHINGDFPCTLYSV